MIDLESFDISRTEVEAILEDLKRDEELRLKPYTDSVGKLTVGYGHNLDDLGISKNIANLMLEEDFSSALIDLNRSLPWWKTLSNPQRRGLLNMTFNLGLPKLLKFKKMLRALESGNSERAAAEAIDSKWAKQVGKRAWRIAALYKQT